MSGGLSFDHRDASISSAEAAAVPPAKSWGHRWEPAKPFPGCGQYPEHWPRCSHGGRPVCDLRAAWQLYFRSVTGRAGRVNERRLMLCQAHAERRAAKLGVPLPPAPPAAEGVR